MSQVKEFDIVFGNPRKVYKAGDTITGSVILNLGQEMQARGLHLIFSGKATVRFAKKRGGKHNTQFSSNENYFETDVNIFPREGIQVGQHAFPFTYHLPSNIPSSFESLFGNVRYSVKAKLGIGWKKTIDVERYFVVFRPLDLNDIREARLPAEKEEELTRCCSAGHIKASLRIPRKGFVPGQAVRAYGEVFNRSTSRVYSLTFAIEQTCTYYAQGCSKSTTKTLKSSVPPAIAPGVICGQSKAYNVSQAVTVPVTAPSKLESCGIINVKYSLVLKVEEMSCHRDLKVDILIGTEPLRNVQYDGSCADAVSPQSNADSGIFHSDDSLAAPRPRGAHRRRDGDRDDLPSYSAYTASQESLSNTIPRHRRDGEMTRVPSPPPSYSSHHHHRQTGSSPQPHSNHSQHPRSGRIQPQELTSEV